MQVNKGGFVGKTCALAKLNDSSGGKRSKRRSKEERKGMVETFVKRHQESNNGSFPSLYLTHKEVGGSYYTVREVFRELIQENRVLAIPKLPPGDQSMENLDTFLEDNPLGSISYDPNVHGLPSKDNQTLVNEYESRPEKVLTSEWISEMDKWNLDCDDDLVNGSRTATMVNEELLESQHMESLNGLVLDGHKDEILEVEPYEGQISHLSEDLVVETFPLRPVFSMVHNIHEETNEKEELSVDLELDTGDSSITVVATNLEEEKLLTPLQESSRENIASSPQCFDSNNSSHSLQHSSSEEKHAEEKKSEMQPSGTIQWQTADAMLKRINIDTFEAAASAKPVNQETNPILSFVKTVVAAFVKFWSE